MQRRPAIPVVAISLSVLASLLFPSCVFGQAGWWKKYSTPGTSVIAVEGDRRIVNGVEVRYYTFKAEGFPTKTKLALLVRDLAAGEEISLAQTVMVDETENVVSQSGEVYKVAFVVMSPGETYQVALGDPDKNKKLSNFVQITPVPIEARDGPCHIYAILYRPYGAAYEVHGEGFLAKENFRVSADSEGESHSFEISAGEDGTWWKVFVPTMKRMSSGTLRLSVESKTCKLSLAIPWENPSKRPNLKRMRQ